MKFTDFIVCEDIRLEVSGQNSLIGVYHESIVFNVSPSSIDTWPKYQSIAIFTRLLFEKNDATKDICRLELFVSLNDELSSLGPMIIDKSKIDESGRMAMSAILRNFPFKSSGTLSVILRAYNDKDETVLEIKAPTSVFITENVVTDQKG